MTDEAGPDEKIIAVPVDKLHPFYCGVNSYLDLRKFCEIRSLTFFSIIRTLKKENGSPWRKWVGCDEAKALTRAALARADNSSTN